MHFEKKRAFIFILGCLITLPTLSSAQQGTPSVLKWYTFNEASELAAENGNQLFLFFEAEWCGFCKQMREEVFPNPEIQDLMAEHFYPVSIDLESESVIYYKGKERSERSFSHLMRINATPTMIFMNSAGDPVGLTTGFLDPSEFEKLLIFVGEGYIEDMDFEEFKKRDISAKAVENQY